MGVGGREEEEATDKDVDFDAGEDYELSVGVEDWRARGGNGSVVYCFGGEDGNVEEHRSVGRRSSEEQGGIGLVWVGFVGSRIVLFAVKDRCNTKSVIMLLIRPLRLSSSLTRRSSPTKHKAKFPRVVASFLLTTNTQCHPPLKIPSPTPNQPPI